MSGSVISSSLIFVILSLASQLEHGALEKRLGHNPLFCKILFLNYSNTSVYNNTPQFKCKS